MLRLLSTLVLAGGAGTMASAHKHALPQEGESARYVCADGRRIEILYGGGEAVVTVDTVVVQMSRDPDAPQELYSGGGWIWSVTGKRSGELARHAKPKGVVCHVG